MKQKVGLAVVTYMNNFGSYLQSYATSEVIKNLGYETEVISIDGVQKEIDMARRKYFMRRAFNLSELRSYLVSIQGVARFKLDGTYARQMAERNAMYEVFRKENFKFSKIGYGWDEISKICLDYSSVVVGSDQLWRPANIEGGYYTLEFVPDKVNKVAYSTSFGVASLPKSQAEKAKQFLPRINHLSVREEKGKALIKSLTGIDVPVVCDPTMLFTREEWDAYVGERMIKDDYVLCYFLGDNEQYLKFAKRLKTWMNVKLVGLVHGAGYNRHVSLYIDEVPFNTGPFEFINLIKYAKCVLTDSFHCCVFSILFEREFFAFRRFKDTDIMSTNDRLTTLFKWTNIEGRLLSGTEEANEKLFKDIDYNVVKRNLDAKRRESMEYLIKALKNE